MAFTKAARPRHRVDGAEARALDEIADRVGAVARSSSRPTQGRAGNGVTCDASGAPLAPKPGSRRQRYCGSACRQARYRARKRASEARQFERAPSWDDPEAFALATTQQYRRNFWNQQPGRCEVWSEKGTVRGVLQPVLDAYPDLHHRPRCMGTLRTGERSQTCVAASRIE